MEDEIMQWTIARDIEQVEIDVAWYEQIQELERERGREQGNNIIQQSL
jgi:hypothetical protein